MSIFSKKVTPEAARAGVYPKRLSYDERQELNAEYDRRHQTSLPKLPSLSIALLLTVALAATWMFIKLTTLFIKASGQSAVFLLFFIFIAICYGVTFFYVKRTLDRLSVSGTKFVIVYVALISVVLGCCHQLGVAPFHALLSLPLPTLLVTTGGHYVATSILAKCCVHFEW